MKILFRFFNRLITPTQLTLSDGVKYWQEKLLLNLLFVFVVLGLVTYLPSVALAIKEELWLVVFIDTFLYFLVLLLFLNRDISFIIRAVSLLIVCYTLGIVLIVVVGPFGAGPVWLFFFPILTGILLSKKMAFGSLLINALTLISIGMIIHLHLIGSIGPFNFAPWYIVSGNPIEKWIVICLNFMLLNIIATLSITAILKGLQESMIDLSTSEKKYRQIFENIQDVYFETRFDGTIVEVSPSIEKVSLYKTEELKGKSLLNFYNDLDQREKAILELSKTGTLKDHEIHFKDKDENVIICSINARLLTGEDNTPIGSIGILRDLSLQKAMEKEKKGLEEQLNRAQKMEALGLLAGGVAHDLNNILSGIVTYPELLSMDLDKDDPMKKGLDIIQSSGQRAAQIVQDLLTLSRRGVISRETLNLNDLILNFMRTPEYKKILSFHPNIHIEKQITANIPFLKGSSIHLQKTLMNLIINAAESQLGEGQIIIRTLNRHLDKPIKGYDQVEIGDYIVLSVEDKGTGISPEDLKRIFEPFFTKKVMGRSGTGLGMAVVWGTVQDHEGYIDIISEFNKGTIFDLYFPICTNEVIMPSKPFVLNDLMGNGERILIVDDMPNQRQIASLALERLGYQTTVMESGEAAIKYLKKQDAQLILLDMIMEPGINGLETYRKILEFKPHQKALIASGYSQTHQVNDTLELGASGYLKKPYTIEKIGAAVKSALSENIDSDTIPHVSK